MLQKTNEFIKEVRLEMTKVTWPSRGELRGSTVVVLVCVAIVALFIAVVDRVVTEVVTRIV